MLIKVNKFSVIIGFWLFGVFTLGVSRFASAEPTLIELLNDANHAKLSATKVKSDGSGEISDYSKLLQAVH